MMKLYKITLGLIAIWALNACGSKTSKNNPPIAIIEELSSQTEGSTVELDASNSYDKDEDNITFSWEQSSGTKIIIINPTSAMPSFIAPNIDSDSIVELTLSVSDGKATSHAKISINIINKVENNNPSTSITSPIKEHNNINAIQNTLPIASIEPLSSRIEGSTVELKALNSYDSDGNIMRFLWKQLSGPEVIILNPTSAMPSFIAPDVDVNSIVELALSVSDGKETTIAKIYINIINRIKEEKRHEVIANDNSIKSSNGMVNISYSYNKNPINEITSGLVLNIYWNSKVLVFNKAIAKLNTDFIGVSSIKEDIDDKDSNENTDKYLSLSWVNLKEGNWKTPSVLSVPLFDLEMKEINNPTGTTSINIQTKVDSPNLHFYGSSVLVSLGE